MRNRYLHKSILFLLFTFFLFSSNLMATPSAFKKRRNSNHLMDTTYATVRLQGQFGNQLFQIAAAYAYALDHNLFFTIPDLQSNPHFDIPHNAKTVFLSKVPFYSPKYSPSLIWKEPHFNYWSIPFSNRIELRGWFQSEKYFSHRKEEILKLFAAPEGFNERILTKYPFLASDQLIVGIQIRDYRSYTPTGEYHPTMGRKYYERAISLFPEETIFMVSSNNPNYARECIEGLAKNVIYLNADYIEEFYTLVLCKSFIISNSTFGWWAAWLSTSENKKVIVPHPWFSYPYDSKEMEKDLIPPYYESIPGL